jgi:hypothetical protein
MKVNEKYMSKEVCKSGKRTEIIIKSLLTDVKILKKRNRVTTKEMGSSD